MKKISIQLSDFVDFIIKSGSSKLTKVRTIKNRPPYHPSKDFWRPLRKQIIQYHIGDKKNKKEFDKLLLGLTDKKKINRYPELIQAYKRFLGRKKITHFAISKRTWSHGGLEININPEIGLIINDQKYIIKFYFKADKLSKSKIEVILLLLEKNYKAEISKGVKVGILDVPKSKLISFDQIKDLTPLLIGEANSFESIWKSL